MVHAPRERPLRLRDHDAAATPRPGRPEQSVDEANPGPWLLTEEAYNFDVNPRTRGAKILVELDESYSKGGTMGPDHPFSWRKAYDGGRSWYTNGGANSADYDNRVFVEHVLGGIRWAGGF